MASLDAAVITLAVITLLAAFVNGALGYGFSSLTIPVALVFYTNRVLNPAIVVIEVPRHRGRSPRSCLASTCMDQVWYLRLHSAPHPGPGGRMAEAGPVVVVSRASVRDGARCSVFGNDHFGTPISDFVQQSRPSKK